MQQYKKLEKQVFTVSEIENMGVKTVHIASKFKCSIFPIDRKYLRKEEFEFISKLITGEANIPLFSCYKVPVFNDKTVEQLNEEGYIAANTREEVLEKIYEYISEQLRSYIEYVVEHNQYISDMPFIKRKLLGAYHKKDSSAITADNNQYIELANNYIAEIKEKVFLTDIEKECEFELPVDFHDLSKISEIFFMSFNYPDLGLKCSPVSKVNIEYSLYHVFDFEEKNTPIDLSITFSLSDFTDINFNINKRNSADYFAFTSYPGISYPMFNKKDAITEIQKTISTFVDSINNVI